MAKRLDKIIVVDIEATCWKKSPPPGEENEIIEVGICTLDLSTRERGQKRSILVKPERSRVSEFCTNLTTLTQEQVEAGVSFREACRIIKKEYQAPHRTWCSYGDYDRRQFRRQCERYDVSYPFSATHLNIKNLLALVHKLSREPGLKKALEILDLPLEGTHHRGVDDAWNTALILARTLEKLGKFE